MGSGQTVLFMGVQKIIFTLYHEKVWFQKEDFYLYVENQDSYSLWLRITRPATLFLNNNHNHHRLLTSWSRILPKKLTGSQLAKKFPELYGTRRFITAFTSTRHLSLSWANSIQFIPPHPTSWKSILILFSHLRPGLPSGLFPSGFPTRTLCTPLPYPYAPRAPPISFSFDASLVIYINSTNIPPIMIINRIYENQNLLSL